MKRIYAMLIAILMLTALFSGCGGNEKPEPDNAGTAPTAAPGEQSSGEQPSVDEGTTAKLPLTDTPVTLEAWWPVSFTLTVIPKMEENLVFKEMATRTNVSVAFTTPAQGSVSEAFNLLVASQDYPDMLSGFPMSYTKGLDFAIDDQVIVPLEDYLNVMPNINALRESNEVIRKGTTTDKGHLAGIPYVKTNQQGTNQGAWVGGVIRQDWLDKLGMEAPKTYDQMETVLKAMQDNGLAQNPLWIKMDGFNIGSTLYAGFNVINGFYQVDGKAKYGPMEPGYREYLEKLNDWYKKGFLSPDFYSAQDYFGPIDKVANNTYGVFDAIYTWNTMYKQAASDAGFKLSPIRDLVKNEGEPIHLRMSSDIATTNLCVGFGSQNVELVCRYWDYLFSEEGILLSNYGVEGQTFEYDENNNPKWSGPLVSDAPEFNLSDTQGAYFLYNCAGYILYDRELSIVEPEAVNFVNVWDQDGADYYYPGTATMTSDESTSYATVMGDINTFITENVVKFVTGEKSFDEYDAFLEQIKTMGVDTAIAAKQAALDRYNAR